MKNAHGLEAEMAAVVVHQLRNRLSRVLFGADALLACPHESADARTMASRLKRGVDDLTGWLDQLVELTQLLSGAVELRLESLDLRAIVHDAIEHAQPMLAARRHSIALEGFDEPLPLQADKTGVQLVVSNLVSNAAKFTPPGGHLSVRAVEARDALHLYVVDDGVGIPPERLAQLFEVQAAEARAPGASRQIQAGLFVVRRILDLHGGSIHVRAVEPRGTEVVACLPRGETAQRAKHVPGALVVSAGRTGALCSVLRSRGYRVDVAAGGEEALALARDVSWDVVLVDAGVAAREEWLAERLRAASLGATLLLVGIGPRTLGMAAAYDGALGAGFDADLLHAAVVAG